MKFLNILYIFLVALVASSLAQRCRGGVSNPSCSGGRDIGRLGWTCVARIMWYYNARFRECYEMRYRGCQGNNNRWCTRDECIRSCRR